MDESKFDSLHTPFSIYCSQSLQEEALGKPPTHTLSCTIPTYIHLFIQSGAHNAAVQIYINPFTLAQYPKQTFFACEYRYAPCCKKASQDNVARAVREKVQLVSYTLYQPGRWDFSDDNCVNVDSVESDSHIPKESCLKVTSSRLCKYFKSASATGHTPGNQASDDPPSIQEQNGVCHDVSKPRYLRNTRDDVLESDYTRIQLDSTLPSDKRIEVPSKVTPLGEEARNQVDKAAKKIRRGLKNLEKTRPGAPYLSKDKRSTSEKARYYEDYFWDQGRAAEAALEGSKWYNRLISSCFRLIRVNLEKNERQEQSENDELEDEVGSEARTRKTWQAAAELINSIVNGLIEHWGWKAYLIYPALESTGFNFSVCSRFSWDIRQDVISSLVEILRTDVPAAEQSYYIDPAYLASYAINMDYRDICVILKLDNSNTLEVDSRAKPRLGPSVLDQVALSSGYRAEELSVSKPCSTVSKNTSLGLTSFSMAQAEIHELTSPQNLFRCAGEKHQISSDSQPDNTTSPYKKRRLGDDHEADKTVSGDGIQNIHLTRIETLPAPAMDRNWQSHSNLAHHNIRPLNAVDSTTVTEGEAAEAASGFQTWGGTVETLRDQTPLADNSVAVNPAGPIQTKELMYPSSTEPEVNGFGGNHNPMEHGPLDIDDIQWEYVRGGGGPLDVGDIQWEFVSNGPLDAGDVEWESIGACMTGFQEWET